jgi:hypothetical protein
LHGRPRTGAATTDGPRTGVRGGRPAGLTFAAEVSVHFPASARCPAGFPGRGGRGRAGAVMAGLAVRESVTLAGRAERARASGGGTAGCRRGGPPAGFPGGGDCQRKWQTVYRDSRTCRPSMSSANLPANTGTRRQRSPIPAADVLDTAVINLPAHSQTDISVKLIKQSSVAGRRCVTYVNSLPLVRGNVSVQYPVPAPRSVPACPRLPGLARACGQVRAGARGGRRAARAGAERRPAKAERREGGR